MTILSNITLAGAYANASQTAQRQDRMQKERDAAQPRNAAASTSGATLIQCLLAGLTRGRIQSA